MLYQNLPLRPSKQLLILFYLAYGSLLFIFLYVIFFNSWFIGLLSFLLIIMSTFSLFKNIQLHAYRTSNQSIVSIGYNEKGWYVTYKKGNLLDVLLKEQCIFSLGKFLLISAEAKNKIKIPIILCGNTLSEVNWRRLYKNLKISTQEKIIQ